ncbi:MAG: hypothetical protein WA842_09175 [Croceibacterium sp.]
MVIENSAPQGKSQLDKFKKAAHELECDDDEQRFKERLGKLVAKKDQPPSPPSD